MVGDDDQFFAGLRILLPSYDGIRSCYFAGLLMFLCGVLIPPLGTLKVPLGFAALPLAAVGEILFFGSVVIYLIVEHLSRSR